MNTLKRSMSVAAAVLLTGTVFAAPAHAEGSWSSYIKSWLPGHDSRHWQDSRKDNNPTKIGFSGCSLDQGGKFSSITVSLYDDKGLLPDVNKGRKTMGCATRSWGKMTRKDKYHFTLDKVNGGTHNIWFSAKHVKVSY